MAWHGPVSDLGWTLSDHDHTGDSLLLLREDAALGSADTPNLAGTQPADELCFQLALCLNEQCLADGLVRHAHRLIVREIFLEPDGDLLWRPCDLQALVYLGQKKGSTFQLRSFGRPAETIAFCCAPNAR